jgi:hypothetical protein
MLSRNDSKLLRGAEITVSLLNYGKKSPYCRVSRKGKDY